MRRFSDGLSKIVQRKLEQVYEKITDEMEDAAMVKVAKIGSTTIRREMRRKGVRRSEETGTALGRSASEDELYRKHESILETKWKVSKYTDGVVAFFGVPAGRAYVARMVDQGTDTHHLWQVDRLAQEGQKPKNYLKSAEMQMRGDFKDIVAKGVRSAVKKVPKSVFNQKRK